MTALDPALPDVESLLSKFLRDQAEITAVCGERVYTAIPKDPTWPLIQLTRVSGAPVLSRPLRLDEAGIQLDVYGGSKKQAHDLAELARRVIAARVEGTHDLGVVTGYAFGPMSWLPDDSYSPSKARYVVDVTIFAHA